MADNRKSLEKKATRTDVNAFLRKVAATPTVKEAGETGRLLFAMDATASRAPMWDRACHIQAEMFKETTQIGGLSIQLVYFHGYGEFNASRWHNNASDLLRDMTAVFCLGGMTQLEKVLKHAIRETKQHRIQALVFVGDCIEEDPARLEQLAGQLGMLGVPAFMFQEGKAPLAERVFRQIAKLTNGAYCNFDATSAQHLRDLLSAVAVYAAGGRRALENYGTGRSSLVNHIVRQLPKSKR